MYRYFSCFLKRPNPPLSQEIPLPSPLKISRPPEDLLEGDLPTTLDELKLLEFKVADRMSLINGIANRIHADYLYCMTHKNLSRAVHLQRLYTERIKEVRNHSARIQEINEAIDTIVNPPYLQLPPPALTIRVNPIVRRRPSFVRS